jgi:glutamate transport system substrate-binding protein
MIVRRATLLVTALGLALTVPACGDGAESSGGAESGRGTGAAAVTAAATSDKCAATDTVSATAADTAIPGSPTASKIRRSGRAVVGVKFDQPNLGYRDVDNNRCGFDIQVAKLIAAKLGVSTEGVVFKEIPSADREIAIKSGQIDYYVGTYSITDKRKQEVSFAGPYFVAGQDLLVRRSDTSITGKDALAGKRVCSASKSTAVQRVRDQNLTESGNVVEFKTYSECVTQLLDGRVDAVTTDDAILKGFAAQNPSKLKVVGNAFSQEKYGIGLSRTDKPLRDRINDVLEAAVRDGTWKKIYDSTLGRSGTAAEPPTVDRY